jgi:hypothetical protein
MARNIDAEEKAQRAAVEAAQEKVDVLLAADNLLRDQMQAVQDQFIATYNRLVDQHGPIANELSLAGHAVQPLAGKAWQRAVSLQEHRDSRLARGKSPGFPGV